MYVIDNSNFCYKFSCVHNYAKTNINGIDIDISVLVGYIKTLKALPFDTIYIAIDGYPRHSKQLLPSYKGTRNNERSGELSVSWLELFQFLSKSSELFNKDIKVVCSPCQEADQVISSIVYEAVDNCPNKDLNNLLNTASLDEDKMLGYLAKSNVVLEALDVLHEPVIIGTTDSDMHMLLRFNNVFIDSSTSGKCIYNNKTPKAVHNMNPSAIVIYKALCGDISDNVPAIIPQSKNLITLLDNEIKSQSDVDYFISQCYKPLDSSYLFYGLCKSVNNCISDFERNLDITNLRFYSTPFVLSFPDYDINSTISKYKLKL